MSSIDLIEVITQGPATGRAYGMTFSDETLANAYADAMRQLGYKADVSPVFGTEPTLKAALESAATFYADHRIAGAIR